MICLRKTNINATSMSNCIIKFKVSKDQCDSSQYTNYCYKYYWIPKHGVHYAFFNGHQIKFSFVNTVQQKAKANISN